MVFNNKIEAIKRVRAIGYNVTVTPNDRGELVINKDIVCLKDAKDIVEAIMELGFQQALSEGARRLRQLEAAGATENEHEARLRALAHRNWQPDVKDDIKF